MAKTKINEEGYVVFEDSNLPVHRWAAEKKHNLPIPDDFEVHHLNKDKKDNSKQNLIVLHRDDHFDLHQYENKRDFMLKIIIVLGALYLLQVFFATYFNIPINLGVAGIFAGIITLLAIELKTHYFGKMIRRPSEN